METNYITGRTRRVTLKTERSGVRDLFQEFSCNPGYALAIPSSPRFSRCHSIVTSDSPLATEQLRRPFSTEKPEKLLRGFAHFLSFYHRGFLLIEGPR